MTRHQRQVLVVSELHSIYSNIQRILTTQGLHSTHIQTVDKASIAIEERPFHIIILDGRLPQSSDFYQRLRHTLQLPVLVLTENNSTTNGSASVIDKDDCLHLSFEPTELIDAVHTVRRRCDSAQAKKTPPIHLGPVTINLGRFEATRDGEVIRLTRTEWALLEQLASHANTTLTHQVLLQRVWGDAYIDEHSYLHTYTRRLRRKLEPDPANPCYLVTDVGIGYRLMVSQNSFGDSQDSSEPAPHSEDTPARSHQLTAPPTSFLGREHDLDELQKLLEIPNIHLLTLTGPPGVGKTRLALHLVEHVRDRFADGAYVISLAPLQESALVVSAIAQALEIKEVAQQTTEETLKQALQKRELLLLLDNFEHVLDAAPVLVELITAAPHLTILVTSRTSLRVTGEQEYLVAPLEMPDTTTIITKEIAEANPAVQLFVQRSQSVKVDFALTEENAAAIAAICTRLDGLPLAIELAAARSKLFTPRALLARLDERLDILTRGLRGASERHQTLRAALEWSYNLLTPEEQQVLMGLSVFVGGCTLEAATAVLDSDQVLVTPLALTEQTAPSEPEPIDLSPSTSFLDKIASLVDHSLIQVQTDSNGETRFVLLETVREYASEKLQENGKLESIKQRHAEYYLWLVEKAAPELERAQQQWWMNHLTEELENIRTVIASKLNEKHFEMIARLASGLRWFCYIRGHCSEAQTWITPILNHRSKLPIDIQTRLVTSGGFILWTQGNPQMGKDLLQEGLLLSQKTESLNNKALSFRLLGWFMIGQSAFDEANLFLKKSLELYEDIQDKAGIARVLNNLGIVTAHQNRYKKAFVLFSQSLALAQELQDKHQAALCLLNLGATLQNQEKYTQAISMIEQALIIFQEVGSNRDICSCLLHMGNIELLQNHGQKAEKYYKQCLILSQKLNDKYTVSKALVNQSRCSLLNQDYIQAHLLCEEGLAIARELKNTKTIVTGLFNLGIIELTSLNYSNIRNIFKESLILSKNIGIKRQIFESLDGLTIFFITRNWMTQAIQLQSACTAQRKKAQIYRLSIDRSIYDKYVSEVRTSLETTA